MLIAVMGWSRPSDIERAQDAGFEHHFGKPVDLERLRALLAELDAGRLQ